MAKGQVVGFRPGPLPESLGGCLRALVTGVCVGGGGRTLLTAMARGPFAAAGLLKADVSYQPSGCLALSSAHPWSFSLVQLESAMVQLGRCWSPFLWLWVH